MSRAYKNVMNWKSIAVTVGAVVIALFIYDFISSRMGHYEEEGA